MTPEEWKERCAKRYIERAGVSVEIAKQMAEACFKAEQDAADGPFSETADYCPEDCADNDMSCWEYD